MNTREKILQAVLANQPEPLPLPDISAFGGEQSGSMEKYLQVFRNIGGTAELVDSYDAIGAFIRAKFDVSKRVVTTLPELAGLGGLVDAQIDPHQYQNVEVAVIGGAFCVAENGAVWLTEALMGLRIIPYICQH